MLIGIDASRVNRSEKTGTENYSFNLIKHLSLTDKTNQYRLYVRQDYDKFLDSLPDNFEVKIIKPNKFWTQIGLSLEMLLNKPEALFVPAHTLPTFAPKNSTITIHDLGWKYYPQVYSNTSLLLHHHSIKKIIKTNTKIIVYSKSTLKDLNKFYKVNKDNIRFVTMGYDKPVSNPVSNKENNKFNKYVPYILSVGRLESRKNTINIIKAYKLLRKERKIKHKLLLAGKPGYGYEEIRNEIENSEELRNDIIKLGYVADENLPDLYKNASLLVYPSLYEGFGYPILEAFTFGIPVITSDKSSMKEIAEDAAILVNPDKFFEITAAMSQIINKPEIVTSLKLKSKKILPKYSWESCAEETLKVLEEIR